MKPKLHTHRFDIESRAGLPSLPSTCFRHSSTVEPSLHKAWLVSAGIIYIIYAYTDVFVCTVYITHISTCVYIYVHTYIHTLCKLHVYVVCIHIYIYTHIVCLCVGTCVFGVNAGSLANHGAGCCPRFRCAKSSSLLVNCVLFLRATSLEFNMVWVLAVAARMLKGLKGPACLLMFYWNFGWCLLHACCLE